MFLNGFFFLNAGGYAQTGDFTYSGASSLEASGLPYILTTVCEYVGHSDVEVDTAPATAESKQSLRGGSANNKSPTTEQESSSSWPYPPKLPSVDFMGRSYDVAKGAHVCEVGFLFLLLCCDGNSEMTK